MIRDVGSLDVLKSVISQVTKNLGIASSQPVSIDVMDKLDAGKYLIKLGDKTLEALSQKELTLNAKYWAEIKTEDGGLVKLLNLSKKPEILQNSTAQAGNTLSNVLDFEKLKSAVNDYVKEKPKGDDVKSNAEQSGSMPKNSPDATKELPQKTKEEILTIKQEVESKLSTSNAPAKDSIPKDETKKSETLKENPQPKIESKSTDTAKDVQAKQPEKFLLKEERVLEAQKQIDLPESKRANTPAEVQKKEQVVKQEESKNSMSDPKKVADQAEASTQKEEVKSSTNKNEQRSLDSASQSEAKEKSSAPVKSGQEIKKEETNAKNEQVAKKDQQPTSAQTQPLKNEVKSSGESIQKQEIPKNEQKITQNSVRQEDKVLAKQPEPTGVTKKEANENTREAHREASKAQKENEPVDVKRATESLSLESLKIELASGEISKDEIKELLNQAVEQELLDTDGHDDSKPDDDSSLASGKADDKGTGAIDDNTIYSEIDMRAAQELESNMSKQEAAKTTSESKDTPASKIKSEILSEMSKTESKEQFQIMSNLALNLNRSGFTMFVKGEDGKDGVLQFRKKAGGVLTLKTVEFYSAFEHLGPIAGEISQLGDQTYLSMEVEFESTMKALASTMGQLEFFDKKNVTVRHGIKQLFEIKSSLLNLVG